MVLGLEWLASLGEIKVDFGELLLKVKEGDGMHVVRKDPALSGTQVSLKLVGRAFKDSGQGFLGILEPPAEHNLTPIAVEAILEDFRDLF